MGALIWLSQRAAARSWRGRWGARLPPVDNPQRLPSRARYQCPPASPDVLIRALSVSSRSTYEHAWPRARAGTCPASGWERRAGPDGCRSSRTAPGTRARRRHGQGVREAGCARVCTWVCVWWAGYGWARVPDHGKLRSGEPRRPPLPSPEPGAPLTFAVSRRRKHLLPPWLCPLLSHLSACFCRAPLWPPLALSLLPPSLPDPRSSLPAPRWDRGGLWAPGVAVPMPLCHRSSSGTAWRGEAAGLPALTQLPLHFPAVVSPTMNF